MNQKRQNNEINSILWEVEQSFFLAHLKNALKFLVSK